MQEERKQTLKKAQFFVAVSLLLVSVLVLFNNSGITGHFSADFKSQFIDISIEQSQSYIITSTSNEPIKLSSFRLSGDITGNGYVYIFIEDSAGVRYTVYENVREKEEGLPEITGMSILPDVRADEPEETEDEKLLMLVPLENVEWEKTRELKVNEEYISGQFENKCSQTCFIEMDLSSENTYKLVFMIQPRTRLELTKIMYSLNEG